VTEAEDEILIRLAGGYLRRQLDRLLKQLAPILSLGLRAVNDSEQHALLVWRTPDPD
jgi:hypothetical protein